MSSNFNFSCSQLLSQCYNNPELPKTFMTNAMPTFIELFAQFEKEARFELKHWLEKGTYRRGEYLRQANQPTQCLWLIEKGIVIEEVTNNEVAYVHEFHFAGEFIGNYVNYSINQKNTCGLVVYKAVEAWMVPCEIIEEWAKRYHSLSLLIEQLTNQSLHWHKSEMAKIKTLPCVKAIAYLKQNYPQYLEQICQTMLASFLRCSEKTINRYAK